MELKLERNWKTENSTIGLLTIDGNADFFTLEDVDREIPGRIVAEWKVDGKTAIPIGKYKVVINYSPHFKRHMPELLDVPGFKGVRIHAGNKPADTDGCLLVGMAKGPDCIYDSRRAYDELYTRIAFAFNNGEDVTLEIT